MLNYQKVVQATNIFGWTWCFKLRKWLSQRRLQWRGSEVFYSLLQADGFSLVFARREGSWDYGCIFNDMIPFLQCGAPSFCLLLNTKVYKSPISTRTPTLRLVVRILLVTVGQTVEILTRYPMMSNDIPGLSGCSLDFPIELYPTWRQKKTSDCNWRTMTSKATWMSAGLTGASRTWF